MPGPIDIRELHPRRGLDIARVIVPDGLLILDHERATAERIVVDLARTPLGDDVVLAELLRRMNGERWLLGILLIRHDRTGVLIETLVQCGPKAAGSSHPGQPSRLRHARCIPFLPGARGRPRPALRAAAPR